MSGAPISYEPPSSFFAVAALSSCPHAQVAKARGLLKFTPEAVASTCACDSAEKWICLFCSYVGCSSYVEGHAKRHYEHANDSQTCSLSYGKLDGSIWCFSCDSYIDFFNEDSLWEVYSLIYASLHSGEQPSLPIRFHNESNPG